MNHWSSKYIGKPYAEADCAMLAALVLKNEFNHSIDLPTERSESVFNLSAMIGRHTDDYAELTDNPQEGDAVLMRTRGRLNHVGIYCEIKGQGYVLHAMRNAKQACLHPLTDLQKYNLSIEGFYKWL